MKSEKWKEGLIENLEKYETLVNNLSVGVYRNTPGPKGHFLEANPAMVAMFEADSRDEFMMLNVSDLYEKPEDRELFVEKITKSGSVKNEELHLVTLKGRKLTASVTAVMKKDKDGAEYFDGIIEDITSRKETENALKSAKIELEIRVKERTTELNTRIRELENAHHAVVNVLEDLNIEKEKAENLASDLKKFKQAVDNASDHIVITDPEAKVIYANAACLKTTGYSAEEVIGQKAGKLWGNLMERSFYENMWKIIKYDKQVFVGEMTNRRKNGQDYQVAVSISPIMDQAMNILFFVGLERDITKEKEIDKAKNEFISLASHQMRTPLTAINWYSEMILDESAGKLNEKQKEYFGEIYAADRRMNEIVKSFLHILSLETGAQPSNPVLVDAIALMRSSIDELRLEIDRKQLHTIEQFEEPLPPLMIDEELTHVIFQNLLSNAAKYSPKNGEIRILMKGVKTGDANLGRTIEQDSLLVSVHDTGLGISPVDHDKIFGKFFRTENAKKWDPNGNGLGLYMTKIMLTITGGEIWFTSELGKGTTFYILLPLEQKKLDILNP